MEALKRRPEELRECDGFSVEDLLDLEGFCEADGDEVLPTAPVVAVDQSKSKDDSQQSSVVPYELPEEHGVDELEWLSCIRGDSLSELPPTPPQPPSSMVATSLLAAHPPQDGACHAHALLPLASTEALLAPVKAKRSKRSRALVWPLSVSVLASPPPTMGGRCCSHCGVWETPQWRAGPEGKRTLCDACGIRYRSGGLLLEYRPACSPSFVSTLHSNSSRKVLEIRRKKTRPRHCQHCPFGLPLCWPPWL